MESDVMQGQNVRVNKGDSFSSSPVSKRMFKSWFESAAEKEQLFNLIRFRGAKLTCSIFMPVMDTTQQICPSTGTSDVTLTYFITSLAIMNVENVPSEQKRNRISKMDYCVIFPHLFNANNNLILLSFSCRAFYAVAITSLWPPKIKSFKSSYLVTEVLSLESDV